MTFKEKPLVELCEIVSSKRVFAASYQSEGVPFFRGKEVSQLARGEDTTAELYISNEVYKDVISRTGPINSGDILLTAVGTLGNPYQVKETDLPFYFKDGNIVWLRKFSKEINSTYLFYWLNSEYGRRKILDTAIGSTQAALTITGLAAISISCPSLAQQTGIVGILSAIDQKITINNVLSKTLEGIAQTIFKSWFIDFDPVKSKMTGGNPEGMDAATAALFPDSMEESEIGVIPKGWEVKTLGDICATTIGGLWGNDDESPENPDSYQCIRGVDMDDLKASGFAPRVPVRWDKTHNFSKRLLSGTQILIAGSGAGPVAKSLLWDEAMNNLFPQPVVFSNFVKRFECNSNEMASFVSSILSTMYESREIFKFVNGTSVPNLQDRELLTGKKVAVPSIDLLRAFDNIKRTSIKRKYSGENSNLVAIRDSLLPRLISGELQIPEEMLAS
jgi:type I restriction enzyme, S subunit